MNKNYFERMRADFLAQYGNSLCEESLDEVAGAQDLKTFIILLHRYMHYLCYKQMTVPTVEWVRKWFADYKVELNENGIFLDQIAAIENPTTDSVILFGASNINVILAKSQTIEFTLEDNSQLNIVAYYSAYCNVRLKGAESKATVIQKSPQSKIKIRKI